jgi:dipeptidyl aminopeptidase/acylaminoacyl peptidase
MVAGQDDGESGAVSGRAGRIAERSWRARCPSAHPLPLAACRFLLTAHCSLLLGCGSVSPLRHHAVVGRDTYAVFVGDGPDRTGDLFGVRGDGGRVFQITFTAVAERRPALSPDGSMVAFLRARARRDTLTTVWVMNLLTGAERRLELPAGAEPESVGWGPDGRRLLVSAGRFAWELPAPPETGNAAPVPPGEWRRVDSALGVFVGAPAFARVFACEEALCAGADTGTPVVIADRGRDPARWGRDSVGYFVSDELLVRPNGPGRARRVGWIRPPPNPRELTAFTGPG